MQVALFVRISSWIKPSLDPCAFKCAKCPLNCCKSRTVLVVWQLEFFRSFTHNLCNFWIVHVVDCWEQVVFNLEVQTSGVPSYKLAFSTKVCSCL